MLQDCLDPMWTIISFLHTCTEASGEAGSSHRGLVPLNSHHSYWSSQHLRLKNFFTCYSNEFIWNLQWFDYNLSPKSPTPTFLPSAKPRMPASVWSGQFQRDTGNFQALGRTNRTWGLLPTLPTVLTAHKIQMKANNLPFPPSFGMKLPTFCLCCSTCSTWETVSTYEMFEWKLSM